MFQDQKSFKHAMVFALACLAILFVATVGSLAAQQEVKAVLFKEANTALQTARKANAEVLAPQNFGEAMKHYQEAEADLRQGKSLDNIRTKLHASSTAFQKAVDATKLAEVTFANSIKARKDALVTESSKFALPLWTEA